ncbi:MAG TPA: hypothetical protein VK976_09675 [Verrucomicrobiae bacterium]|jgi:hypothetical protein|nr:hypothetical protein [Verrucomicrobiae bacterium]
MSPDPGSSKLLKAGFVQIDASGKSSRVVVFQYNPETLSRQLEAVSPALPPRETVTFTVFFDAADQLDAGNPLTQQAGVLPALSALQILLYPASGSVLVWVTGSRQVTPVHITTMQIIEQAFDATLNPIRAEVTITLRLLKDSDLSTSPRGQAIWNAYLAQLQQLAQAYSSTISFGDLGLSGI